MKLVWRLRNFTLKLLVAVWRAVKSRRPGLSLIFVAPKARNNARKAPILMTRLSELQQGERVRVVSVDGGEMGRRLVEMGVYPGREVALVCCAPLRDPIAYQVGGSRLSLRRSEAALVTVENF